MFNNMITPKNAKHVLEEHCISGGLFLEMNPSTQHAIIADCLMKEKSSLKLLIEFRKGAAVMAEAENRRRNRQK